MGIESRRTRLSSKRVPRIQVHMITTMAMPSSTGTQPPSANLIRLDEKKASSMVMNEPTNKPVPQRGQCQRRETTTKAKQESTTSEAVTAMP